MDTTDTSDEDGALVNTKAPWIVKPTVKPTVESPSTAKKRKPNPNYFKFAFRKIWGRDFLQLNPFSNKSVWNPWAEREKKIKKGEMLDKAQKEYEK